MRLHIVRGIATLALALLIAPLATDAQQPTKVFRIGLLYGSSPLPGTAEAFRQGLRDLGYVEGQNLVIEQRWAERSEERLRELATELVQLQVDVLVAQGGLYTLRAAKAATSTIDPCLLAEFFQLPLQFVVRRRDKVRPGQQCEFPFLGHRRWRLGQENAGKPSGGRR